MLNRPLNPLVSARDAPAWEVSGRPRARLALLFAALLAPVVSIAARLVYVQTYLGDGYAAEFERSTEEREPIPSRDGRILSADGQVLAEDVEYFGLKVHYRWLEEPADAAWLRQQALARLDRAARRQPERVAEEERVILRRRSELWSRLQSLAGLDRGELNMRRTAIQRRVEHVYDLVARRRGADRRGEPGGSQGRETPGETAWWDAAWSTVVSALTTPPQREADEPLVIREQLDYHLLLSEIPLESAVEIEAHPERYPGTRIETRTRRVYPQGDAAAHLIGFRTPLDETAVRARREKHVRGDPLDYRVGDRRGQSGLELQYERHLRGLRGERRVVFNRRGELVASEVLRQPRFGRDLILSLQLPLQRAAEQLLDERLQSQHVDETTGKPLPVPTGGAVVALDVRTGAVLASASAPRFNLQAITDRDGAAWRGALEDQRKPMFHRAAEMALPPGSVFKVVSSIAFLESGRLDPDQAFHCQGYLDDPDRNRCLIFRNFGVGHGDLTLVGALARSCNVYFFSAARKVGHETLRDWATRFEFGRPTGIDLPRESAGTLPPSGTRVPIETRSRNDRRSRPQALQLAIGQGELTATPLQVARLMAAIANEGRLVTPRLGESEGPAPDSSATTDSAIASVESHPIEGLTSRSLQWVRLGLREVVAHQQGTGYRTVRLNDVAIAGKTGTAEPGGGRPDHAWFAGYVPADRPKIAFVVVLEHAGSGGHAAGPVAREFVQAMQALGLVERRPVDAPSAN